jgi:putative nucleotidyltransferase with HDIG domain
MENKRVDLIKAEIRALHEASESECMRTWFYDRHVTIVADYAEELAAKFEADVETVVLAALFHDIARTWGVNGEPALMDESLAKAREIMVRHGYSEAEIIRVLDTIASHSCREIMPVTEEQKVMATADALAHLMTDFYLELPFYGWLFAAKTFADYKRWLISKIDRDIGTKMFYEEYRLLAQPRYEALHAIFAS